jgi:hypothetical protein
MAHLSFASIKLLLDKFNILKAASDIMMFTGGMRYIVLSNYCEIDKNEKKIARYGICYCGYTGQRGQRIKDLTHYISNLG